MDYKASDDLLESLRDLFHQQIKMSPELTETIRPEVMFMLLETMRYLGMATVVIEKDGTIRYDAAKGNAPIIIEEQKRRKDEGKIAEILHKIDLVNTKKLAVSDVETYLAENFLQDGKLDEALDTLDLLEKTQLSDDLGKNVGRISRIKGAIAFFRGDYDSSLEHFNHAVQMGELTDDLECVAFSLVGLGNLYGSKGEYEEAFQKYERAFLLFKETENLYGMAKVKINLSYTYSRMGQLENSSEASREAIELCQRINDVPLLQLAYLNRSALLMVLGLHQDAYETIMNSYYLSIETGNKRIFHLSRLSMLSLDIATRKVKLEYQFLKDATDYFNYLNSELDTAYCQEVTTEYYIANGLYEETKLSTDLLIDLYAQVGDDAGFVAAAIKIIRCMVIYQSDNSLITLTHKKVLTALENKKLINEYKGFVNKFLPKN